jgi:UDPglucose--hexose-1-phosphate uridylyltransferase
LGAHEVIIETPRHVVSLTQLSDRQVESTFVAYQDRLRYWQRDERLAHGLVFKNARSAGGASLEHTHSQLLAIPFVPDVVAQELSAAEAYWRMHGRCVFCDLQQSELASQQRIVRRTPHFLAYCPYASRFAYEMMVIPLQHARQFEELLGPQRDELAHLVRDLIRRLEAVLPEPAYNYWIHSAPWRGSPEVTFHWHLELVPRLTRLAGFELGTGYSINPVSPEEAASRLRSC